MLTAIIEKKNAETKNMDAWTARGAAVVHLFRRAGATAVAGGSNATTA
jgi:hypothetical protein